ncbi:hypothetical protein V5O48_014759 [Marasmius crinis-equi]|uniref:F-box domain-containing protein n=1 Tax=Marasmius crinis-equi TaxID=585013 RepID=A0ABR3EWD9_9AGAR
MAILMVSNSSLILSMDSLAFILPKLCSVLPVFHFQPDILLQLRNPDRITLSPTTTSVCVRFLQDADSDVATYDKTIQNLESRLLEIKSQRDDLQRNIAQVSSLLSPIRRLPTEILQIIFSIAGIEGRLMNLLGVHERQESIALRISAVCHRWRIIGLDTPDLWTHFAVKTQNTFLEPLKLFLDRSRLMPLSFMVVEPDEGEDDDSDVQLPHLLVEHASRWQSVDHDHVLSEACLGVIEGVTSLPSLRSLVCSRLSSPFLALLNGCGHLDDLIVRYLHFDTLLPDSLPLARVVDLTIEYGRDGAVKDSLEVLKACASTIKSLSYQCPLSRTGGARQAQHTPQPASPEQEPITCRTLSTFSINLYHPDGIFTHISDILRSLTLPALKTLALLGQCGRNGNYEGEWPVHIVEDLFTRSKCVLVELYIDGLPLSEAEILAVLGRTPSLEILTIAEVFTEEDIDDEGELLDGDKLVRTISKAFISSCTVTNGEGNASSQTQFLPNLSALHLLVHEHFDADTEFVEMVKSRWYSPTITTRPRHVSLETVTLEICAQQVDAWVYEPLKALDKEGLKIVVKTRGNGYIV